MYILNAEELKDQISDFINTTLLNAVEDSLTYGNPTLTLSLNATLGTENSENIKYNKNFNISYTKKFTSTTVID